MALKRHTESAVRETIHATRIAEELRRALTGTENEGLPPTSLLILCNGIFSTSTGQGELYDTYVRDKTIGEYTGRNVKARKPDDDDYNSAKLRILPFDHAFNHCKIDVDQRK